MSSLRIVIVAPTVPHPLPDNAGVVYLTRLVSVLSRAGARVTIIVPDTPSARDPETPPEGYDLIAVPVDGSAPGGLRGHISAIIWRLSHTRPPRGFAKNLLADPAAMAALRGADVIDAQWPAMAGIIPLLHRAAPQARLITTLHDVPSQSNLRQLRLATRLPRRVRFLANAAFARRLERRALTLAETVIVFSEKDRRLLGDAKQVEVVLPALATSDRHDRPEVPAPATEGAGYVLFVAPLYRGENRDALKWFADEVWPSVRRRVPDARLLVAGRAPDQHREPYRNVEGIEFAGFVEDLEPLYADASAVVAPLRLGAGVKFKVIDAMVRGVPVVGTTVAFEGIGDDTHIPVVTDDSQPFAERLVDILTSPESHRPATEEWRAWARRTYSAERFERHVHSIYGTPPAPSSATSSAAPEISVVIPVLNGAHLISEQLTALASQAEASRTEVIIADNGSTDRTLAVAEAFRDAFCDLRIVDASARRGVNHARNAGLRIARAETVLICDHDDVVQPGWIAALARALESADLVGGQVVRTGGRGRLIEEDAAPGPELPSVLGHLPYAIGCNLGVRRTTALTIGGFDEAFAQGHDEVDFSWRLQEAGYTIVAAPGAVVEYRQRSRTRAMQRQSYHSARTRILLWVRFHSTADLQPVSLRGALSGALTSLRHVPGLFRHITHENSARAIGWVWGTLAGHVRYRVLRRVPSPMLLDMERPAVSSRIRSSHR